jgi:Flp pilus assembly protein TadD
LRAARVYENQGNVQTALSHYERALAVDPNNAQALVSVARLYDRQDDLGNADEFYRRAMQVAPANPTPYNDLGICYARRGRIQPAIPLLTQAVTLEPLNKLYRNNLAVTLVDAGRVDEALQHLSNAHGEIVARYNLAVLLSRRQQYAAARQQCQTAIALEPNFAAARELLERLDAGSGADNAGRVPSQPPANNSIAPYVYPIVPSQPGPFGAAGLTSLPPT